MKDTVLWAVFCLLWAARSLIVRRSRKYALGRKSISLNARYKVISNLVFFFQVTFVFIVFWFDSPWFLEFVEGGDGSKVELMTQIRALGFVFCYLGLLTSVWTLWHLGRNYSPCYDSHESFELIRIGPYRWIRHPGWLSKLLVGVGGFLVAGTWWFTPVLLWLCFEMLVTIASEEKSLTQQFPEFADYQKQTHKLIPLIY